MIDSTDSGGKFCDKSSADLLGEGHLLTFLEKIVSYI